MINAKQLNHLIQHDIRYFIAFGFGSGRMPIAPGTFGTLAAIPIYVLLYLSPWQFYCSFVFIAFWVGVQISNEISMELNQQDYPGIVWDECVGYWITMFLAPFDWKWILLGFCLFRLFDIIKPPPICQLDQKYQSGFGIMIDDVVAGIMAWCCLQFLIWMLA